MTTIPEPKTESYVNYWGHPKSDMFNIKKIYKDHKKGLVNAVMGDKKIVIDDYFSTEIFNLILEKIKLNNIDNYDNFYLILDYLRSLNISLPYAKEFYNKLELKKDLFVHQLDLLKEELYKKYELFSDCKFCNGLEQREKYSINNPCKKCFMFHYYSKSEGDVTGHSFHNFECYHCLFKESTYNY